MKKNQKTYLLLFAVAIVWGSIGYQLYSNYNPPAPDIIENKSTYSFPKGENKNKSYTIKPDYRDPFLGKIYRKKIPKVKKVTPKPKVVFPNIVFKGIINGSKKSYIIAVNGVQEVFQIKHSFQNVTLVKVTEKAIRVKYQGETKEYTLEE